MHPALLTPVLSASLRGLHRLGWPSALAKMGSSEAQGYAAGIAYMLQARLWTMVRLREPSWREVHDTWGPALGDVALRDGLAGQLHEDDRLELIADGGAGFARRAALYARAVRSIDIASYYLQADDTGRATVQALSSCVRRGVRVRLLVDHFMSFKKGLELPGLSQLLAEAVNAGIELRRWHDPSRPNDSNHRKMIIVDEQVALVGGRNFADHYRGNAWRDVDLVLEGPSVAPLARLFEGVWRDTGRAGGADSGPHSASPWVDHVPRNIRADPMLRFALAAVGLARQVIELELAYFVAHEPLLTALAQAAARGVRVRLLTNSAESNDLPYATWTTYEGVRRLLEAGCQVHARRRAGRTLHCKYLVVDGEWVSFGSHNLDYFSPRFCCETNLVVRDARLGALLAEFFAGGWGEAPALGIDEVRDFLSKAVAQRWFDRLFRDFQ